MKEVAYVQKKGKVGDGKFSYTYAGESELIAQIRPAMVEHGIVMYPTTCKHVSTEEYTTSRGSRVSLFLGTRVFAFHHVDSGEIAFVEVFAEASDGGDKRASKAMTLAKKYALREFFLIETGDDPDAVVQSRGEENEFFVQRASTGIERADTIDALDNIYKAIAEYEHAGFSDGQKGDLKKQFDAKRAALAKG
jgi:hypothetical protein